MDEEKESLARAHLPFRAEYCKTSRARCKKCSDIMEAGTVKLANLVKSRFHDGYDASFYHVPCFFQIKRPGSVAEIRHFETLKYEDQKMLEKAVETQGKSILGTIIREDSKVQNGESSLNSKGRKAKKRNPTDEEILVNYDDFLIEYAKSSRAKCISCEQNIQKNAVRLGKLDYQAETPWGGGPVPRWYHVDCFAKAAGQLEFFGQVKKIKNFHELEEDDQKMVKKVVKQIQPPAAEFEVKKVKTEDKQAEEEMEKLLKKQSDKFFALRENVNSMKRKDIELMLKHMRQKHSFKAPSSLIDAATDVLLFGPLKKCPVCKKHGTIELRGTSYICYKGPEEEPCTYETKEPARGVPDVPEEVTDKYEFFDTYKFRGGQRIFPSKFVKAVEQKEAEDNNLVLEGAPLDGLAIGIITWKSINFDKDKVQKKITTLGGRVTTALDRSVFVILTSEDELERDSPKVEVAKCLEVPFARADFLFKIEKKDEVVTEVTKCLIGKWDGSLQERFNNTVASQVKAEN